MSRVVSLSVRNFRKLKNFDCVFGNRNVICLIGRGDSGKSSILDAIGYVLSPVWNLQVSDYDFTDLNVSEPIRISAVITEFPEELMRDDRYGMFLSGFDYTRNCVDELEKSGVVPALHIEFSVDSTLEPKWEIVNHTSGLRTLFSSKDRVRLNVCHVSDYLNRHLTWANGSPLSALSRHDGETLDSDVLLRMLRKLRGVSSEESFGSFSDLMAKIKGQACLLGLDSVELRPLLDIRQLSVREGSVCLHDDRGIPFRMRGKGSKRLLSIAIQTSLAGGNSISLVDEIEQGLEPDRIRTLVNSLSRRTKGQIIFTTHSDNALVEVGAESVFWLRADNRVVMLTSDMQSLLRGAPDAFFARRVIVCEGATEIGFCRAICDYIVAKGGAPFSYRGIVIVDGSGSTLTKYAQMFKQLGVDTLLFCDSDKDDVNEQKACLRKAGVVVVDWEGSDAFEQGIFKDLPDAAIGELMREAVRIGEADNRYDRISILNKVRARHVTASEESLFVAGPFSREYRTALGDTAKHEKSAWFKYITGGQCVGRVACDAYDQLSADSRLRMCIDRIVNWSGCLEP